VIKGIFFEASGVLYGRDDPPLHYALRLIKEHGYTRELSAEEEASLERLKEQASHGRVRAQTYWDRFLQMHGVADSTRRAELLDSILAHVNKVHAVPGAHETLKALKERGFILGIASSTMYPVEWKMAWLAAAGVAEFLDVVACSTALGVGKPHPVHYWTALTKARLWPYEAAFVSNDDRELVGAHQVGMVAVAVLCDPGIKADYHAETLPDLLNVPIFQR